MRTKSFVLFLICVVITSVFLILVGNQRPSIQTIVTETHKQLKNLKNFKDNLDNAEDKRLNADVSYLSLLGFTEHPRLYPEAVWKNTSLPVILTYVLSGQEQQGVGFARNVAHFLPNHTTVIYNLGLGSYALQTLQSQCNSSRCVVVTMDLSQFPSHVDEERVKAFRPIVIQDMLNKAGAVFFLESDHRLITSRLEPLIQEALTGSGLITWPTHYATSSLTHPKMFDYFLKGADDFLFLPMVEGNKLLVYNTGRVHDKVMLPWVQCALTQDCVHPIGAQDGGCRFNKKPQYRYSGCHRYDTSALNIALGVAFDLDHTRYTTRTLAEALVRRVTSLDAEANVTDVAISV